MPSVDEQRKKERDRARSRRSERPRNRTSPPTIQPATPSPARKRKEPTDSSDVDIDRSRQRAFSIESGVVGQETMRGRKLVDSADESSFDTEEDSGESDLNATPTRQLPPKAWKEVQASPNQDGPYVAGRGRDHEPSANAPDSQYEGSETSWDSSGRPSPTIALSGEEDPPSPLSENCLRISSPSTSIVSHLSLQSSSDALGDVGCGSSSGPSVESNRPTPLRVSLTDSFPLPYLEAINGQNHGDSHLLKQIEVYTDATQRFFSFECDCPQPCEADEPGNTHTIQERVARLKQSLPPLPDIFGETGSYEPSTHFHQWKALLSRQPVEPLSFKKTQTTLPQQLTVTRRWDIDSIWLGATSLAAIQPPNDFRLSFLPHFSLNLATDQIIQSHGLDLSNTRHIPLGSFYTPSVRFTVFMFFPETGRSPGTMASSTSNALSLERQKEFYDQIIIPAVNETVQDPIRQEIPRTFDMAYAKSRSYQEKPGMGRWAAEDVSRAFQLSYTIPAEDLPGFWRAIVVNANQVRIPTRRGEPAAYFQNPCLLMQAHDLKNTFAAPTLEESLSLFGRTVLSHIEPSWVDMRSCWIDIGARDFVDSSSSRALRGSEPFTLLYKRQCNRRLQECLSVAAAPDDPPVAKHFRSFLLRDVGNLTTTVKRSRTPNAGHPKSTQPGIVRAKAYASNKELFAVMFSNYNLFASGFLPLLAFDETMIRDLASLTKDRECSYETRLDRDSLHKAWEANKRHLLAISEPHALANYGLRKEITLRLDAVLKMWAQGTFSPADHPHFGVITRTLATDPEAEEEHYPFWIVQTKDINALIFTQAARLVLPLEHLFKEASTPTRNPSEGPVRRILAFYTAQLLCRLLVHSLSSQQEVNYDKWLWLSKWRARAKGRSFYERRGLGLEVPIKASGMLWIPHVLFDWQQGHIALETLVELYIPRNPLQTRIAAQGNIQALTTSQVTVEFFLKEWMRDAHSAFNDGRKKEGLQIADRLMSLCAEEVARAYNQHVLSKLAAYWERAREKQGRRSLPKLASLERAQKEFAADVCRILTAQTIWEIYSEAWAAYATTLAPDAGGGTSSNVGMPPEIPCWMTTRKYQPPNDGWSAFVFAHLLGRDKAPKWDRSRFLQIYRGFKSLWRTLNEQAGQFDNRLKRMVGSFIMVTFNSDHGKEVGTNHSVNTWYHKKPGFFQIQFHVPYFAPPEESRYLRLDEVCRNQSLPGGLAADAEPRVLTAATFQRLEGQVQIDWRRIMGKAIDEAPEEERNRSCRRALRHMILLAGPNWSREGKVQHIVPWSFGEDDFFRHPVAPGRRSDDGGDECLSEPTIVLPTRDNVMKLLKRIQSFDKLSREVKRRLQWAKRQLHNHGAQYNLCSRLEAKKRASYEKRHLYSDSSSHKRSHRSRAFNKDISEGIAVMKPSHTVTGAEARRKGMASASRMISQA